MNLIKHLLFALAIILFNFANAQTDLQEDAQRALNDKDYITALKKLTPLAEAGEKISLNSLGHLYLNGLGVTQDYEKAMNLFQRSANQGYMKAQYNLGVMYMNGIGIQNDLTKAFDLFKLSAEQGYPPAQYNLGALYESEKTPPEGEVSKIISKIIFGSNSQPRSDEEKKQKLMLEALQWYTKAAEQGETNAQKALVSIYQGSYKPLANDNLAFNWNKKLAEAGDPIGQFNLGVDYDLGLGVAQNYQEAMRWYLLAAAQGNSNAHNNIGQLHLHGNGVLKNEKQAFDWFQNAAIQESNIAQANLGLLYWKGQGVKSDLSKAKFWFEKSATSGNKDAIKYVANINNEIANIQAQTIEQQIQSRNLALGYKNVSFKDFLLDAPSAKTGSKMIVSGYYQIAGELESLAETIQSIQMPNSPRVFLLSDDSPREARRKMLDLKSGSCGYAGICRIEILGLPQLAAITDCP